MDLNALHASTEALEEVAEAYVLSRLSPADLVIYEEHLLICEECREMVDSIEEFIDLLGKAISDPEHKPRRPRPGNRFNVA
jgi:predicted anti-sigma-YlaC factor YlaD